MRRVERSLRYTKVGHLIKTLSSAGVTTCSKSATKARQQPYYTFRVRPPNCHGKATHAVSLFPLLPFVSPTISMSVVANLDGSTRPSRP